MINYLNKNKNIHQSTFSARFPGYIKDEGKFMEMVIKETDAKSFYTYPDQDGFIKNFERLCYYQDEPFGSASIYAQYEVMNLANQNGVTVLLDGQGADEMLGGYSFYLETLSKEHISFENKEKTLTQKLKSFFPRTYGIYHKRKLTKKLISDLKLKGYGEYLIEVATKIDIPEEIHLNLHAHLCHDLTKGNLEDLLRYADRNSMAFSREIRLPFLDKEFVEFVMSLPSSYKINGEWSKWIQRLAFQNILPHEITWRTDKIGYEPPQKNWMFDIRVQEKIRESKIKLYKEGIITKIESERKAEATEANQISDNSWYQMMAANLF
jgi:asparagine synthase (glutamine-hydrolysing)